MTDENILIVESAAYDEMNRLGYLPRVEEEDRIEFTEKLCQDYDAENERLKKKMIDDLAVDNLDDLKVNRELSLLFHVHFMYVRPIKYYYSFLLQIFNIIHSIKLHFRAPLRHTEIITVSELFKSSISFWNML